MAKQMEGDNKQRRAAARKARQQGESASEHGVTTGGSKGPSHKGAKADHTERLAEIQRGEAKQGGPDVPRPLRGKGRRKDPEVPPGP
jgi:hypothetical protein